MNANPKSRGHLAENPTNQIQLNPPYFEHGGDPRPSLEQRA